MLLNFKSLKIAINWICLEASSEVQIPEPEVPPCEEVGDFKKIKTRKRSRRDLYIWPSFG